MVPRIMVNTDPNPMVRVYHTTKEISRYSIHSFWRPLRDSSGKYLEEVGEVGTQLLREVFALPGVNEVVIKPYKFSLTKADAFGWEDIEPGVIEALKKVFGDETPEIVGANFLIFDVVPSEEAVAGISQVLEEASTKGFFWKALNSTKEFLQRLLTLGKRLRR